MTAQILGFTKDHSFLLNSYPAPHILGGITYPTAEHSFQAHKSLDRETRWRISKLTSPREAVDAGNALSLRPDWHRVRISVMFTVLMAKFTFQPSLGGLLVTTGEAELVNVNYHKDTFWGVSNGEGENQLGEALMRVRETIRPLYLEDGKEWSPPRWSTSNPSAVTNRQ